MRSLIRAGGAALGLLAVVTGPPALLWMLRSVFLPDHVPDLAEIVGWFTERDTGQVFLGLLVVAGLVAWLQLIAAILLEAVALTRGTRPLRIAGFGWAHKLAAALLLALLAGAGTAAAAEPAPAIAVTAPADYTVKPGDSLMRIAAEQLGDESRFHEIFQLNQGRPQPDGRTLRDAGLVRPGWTLVLPDKEAEPCGDVVVEHGDTLSTIARDHLGDANRHHELFALNEGQAQQSGHRLSDPNRIYPGMVLRLPEKTSGGGGAAPSSFLTTTKRSVQGPPPCPPTVDEPAAPAPEPTPPKAELVPAAPEPPPNPPPSGDPEDDSVLPLLGVGSLLATVLLGLIGARRLRAQRRRRPGHRIQRERKPSKLDTDLQRASEPGTVEQLDQALRALAQLDGDLPAVRSALVGPRGVILNLTHPVEPASPFRTDERQDRWIFDPTAAFADQSDVLPCPALVSLGHTSRDDLLLVNLAEAGAIGLQGPPADTEAILLALAWELAASPWTTQTTVLLIGFGETTAAHHTNRFRFAPTVEEALGSPADVVLSAHELTAEQTDLLRASAAVVTAGPVTTGWLLDVNTTPTAIDELDTKVELQQLTPAQVDELLDALHEPTQVPAPIYRAVPPEPAEIPTLVEHEIELPEPRAAQEEVSPELRLLGPVELANVDPSKVEAKKINRLTELAAFLMLNPGASADEISRQLGTEAQPWSAATRQGYVSRLRTWLGRDEDGELYVPNVDAGRRGYRLAASVRCDWHRFEELVKLGLAAGENGLGHLRAALGLVRGMPLGDVPRGRYSWSSWHQRDMIDAVVDVAHAVADGCQKAGDLAAARKALACGLRAEPISELLYRDLLRVEYRAGNLAGVKATADKLTELATALEFELDEETSALVKKLLSANPAGSRRD
ncbi:LysM peptidoglycan-binding domain-containing protein [Amycolatopsis magusensis]|uniref:LysM peptidoglycan-binding domain-containing protein n=1 Tax=Amycolatopsis magusensis TaxID=882444 RepID=UPI0037A1E0A8